MRLTRLGRVARFHRIFPEVMTLPKGIAYAMRLVLCTMLLLLMFLYVFGIIFRTQVDEENDLDVV